MSNADNSYANSGSYGRATRSALRNRIDEFSDVLYQDTFKAREIDGGRQEAKSVIEFLKSHCAIESVAREKDEVSNKYVNIWGWKRYQDKLQKYYENRDELPCGCRSHVPGEQDGETYYCKFCGAAHSRETIKGAL